MLILTRWTCLARYERLASSSGNTYFQWISMNSFSAACSLSEFIAFSRKKNTENAIHFLVFLSLSKALSNTQNNWKYLHSTIWNHENPKDWKLKSMVFYPKVQQQKRMKGVRNLLVSLMLWCRRRQKCRKMSAREKMQAFQQFPTNVSVTTIKLT